MGHRQLLWCVAVSRWWFSVSRVVVRKADPEAIILFGS